MSETLVRYNMDYKNSKKDDSRKDIFNNLMNIALSYIVSPTPDYKKAKEKLSNALLYFPDSKDIKNLIEECDQKINKQKEYNKALENSLLESKVKKNDDKALNHYIESIKIEPLHELSKQYDKLILSKTMKIQLQPEYKDQEINELIIKAKKNMDNHNYEISYDIWSELFKRKKKISFVIMMLLSLIKSDMSVKAALLVVYIIENYIRCFDEIEMDKNRVNWIKNSLDRILSSCRFVQSYIEKLKEDIESTNDSEEIRKKRQRIKIGIKKISSIEKSISEFLKEQFFL